jgi:hypothetical protein
MDDVLGVPGDVVGEPHPRRDVGEPGDPAGAPGRRQLGRVQTHAQVEIEPAADLDVVLEVPADPLHIGHGVDNVVAHREVFVSPWTDGDDIVLRRRAREPGVVLRRVLVFNPSFTSCERPGKSGTGSERCRCAGCGHSLDGRRNREAWSVISTWEVPGDTDPSILP